MVNGIEMTSIQGSGVTARNTKTARQTQSGKKGKMARCSPPLLLSLQGMKDDFFCLLLSFFPCSGECDPPKNVG